MMGKTSGKIDIHGGWGLVMGWDVLQGHDGVENSSNQRQVAERNLGRAHIANMNRLN